MALWVDRRPAVELKAARCRTVAQEGKSELAILSGILRPGHHDALIGTRQDLRLAVEVGRGGEKRAERCPDERPARFLPDAVIEEGQALPIGHQQQVAPAICKADSARAFHLEASVCDL